MSFEGLVGRLVELALANQGEAAKLA
jgi:hypothetical protein